MNCQYLPPTWKHFIHFDIFDYSLVRRFCKKFRIWLTWHFDKKITFELQFHWRRIFFAAADQLYCQLQQYWIINSNPRSPFELHQNYRIERDYTLDILGQCRHHFCHSCPSIQVDSNVLLHLTTEYCGPIDGLSDTFARSHLDLYFTPFLWWSCHVQDH